MRLIVEETAAAHGVTVAEMMGPRRIRRIAHARQEAMATIYAETKFSYPQVGEFFGRDHTTVIHAVRRVAERRLDETKQ